MATLVPQSPADVNAQEEQANAQSADDDVDTLRHSTSSIDPVDSENGNSSENEAALVERTLSASSDKSSAQLDADTSDEQAQKSEKVRRRGWSLGLNAAKNLSRRAR